MKIVHLTSGPTTSGAFKGTLTLHKKLLSKNIASYLISDDKKNSENKNIKFAKNNFFQEIKYIMINILNKLPKILYLQRKANAFDNSLFGYNFTKYELIKNADILHLHWINKSYSNLKFLKNFKKPIVWTLRDMWAFTGGCHYTYECKKFKKSCGECPTLNSNVKKDLSFLNQNKKKSQYENAKINFVAISEWLKNEAIKSKLLKNKKINVIYNGIEDKKFYPAKKQNKFSKNKKIILFGSQYINSEYKGFKYFLNSLKYLDLNKYYLITFGNIFNISEIQKSGIEFKNFGFIKDEKKLRKIYSLADVYIASSVQEAFGKTIVESLFCGTPVVCFKKTAISEIVQHKKNGFCAKYLDSKSLAKGIEWTTAKKKFFFKKNCVELTKKKFSSDVMTNNYIKFYKKIYKK